MECFAAAGADLLAFETIPSIKEAQAVAELLREFPNSAAWLSFSCKASQVCLFVCAAREGTNARFQILIGSNATARSAQDGRCISDGSLFTDAAKVASRSPQLLAVGVNCCSPALVEPLLDSAGSLRSPDLSWVVYPNSGEEWDSEQG